MGRYARGQGRGSQSSGGYNRRDLGGSLRVRPPRVEPPTQARPLSPSASALGDVPQAVRARYRRESASAIVAASGVGRSGAPASGRQEARAAAAVPAAVPASAAAIPAPAAAIPAAAVTATAIPA